MLPLPYMANATAYIMAAQGELFPGEMCANCSKTCGSTRCNHLKYAREGIEFCLGCDGLV